MSVETTQEGTTPPSPQNIPDNTPAHLQEKTPMKWETKVINPAAPYQSTHPTSMDHFNFTEKSESETEGEKVDESKEVKEGAEPEGQPQGTEEGESDKSEQEGSDKEEGGEEKVPETRAERLSKKINEIARKENDLRRREKLVAEKEKAKEGLSVEALREKAKADPIAFMEEFGLSYNDVTQFIIDPEKSKKKSESETLKEEVERLRKEVSEDKQSRAEKEAQRSIDQFKQNIRHEISQDTEKYELINANEDYDTVYEVILQYHKEYGKLLSLDEAANLVETELEKNLQAQLEKLSKTTKAQKWGFKKEQSQESSLPKQATSEDVTEGEDQISQIAKNFVRHEQSPRTITGQMVGQSTAIRKRPRTREEAIRDAARLIDAGKSN